MARKKRRGYLPLSKPKRSATRPAMPLQPRLKRGALVLKPSLKPSPKPLRSSWTVRFTAIPLVLTLTACSSLPEALLKPPPPALAEPCPPLSEIRDGQAGTALRWSVATAKAYRLCQLKQAGLVEAWPK